MTDQRSDSDIVERLLSYKVGAHDGPPFHPAICDEAADEIKRLRGSAQAGTTHIEAVDRDELVGILTDMASVNMSSEVAERQAKRMADALIAKGFGGIAYGAKDPFMEDYKRDTVNGMAHRIHELEAALQAIAQASSFDNTIQDAERIASAALSPLPSTSRGSRLTFCEACNCNTMHRRASIVDGVQTFECERCAPSSTDRGSK